jgi:photosystem II stability/assembly factor-like uncharacterized protein
MHTFSFFRAIVFALLAAPILMFWQGCLDPTQGDIERQKVLLSTGWKELSLPRQGYVRGFVSLGSNLVCLCGAEIIHSTNNGVTWSRRGVYGSATGSIGSKLFLGGNPNTGAIVTSLDSGKTWKITDTSKTLALDAFWSRSTTLLAGGNTWEGIGSSRIPQILRSTNNGATWTKVSADALFPQAGGRIASIVHIGNAIFAGFLANSGDGKILRSNDDGLTWAMLPIRFPYLATPSFLVTQSTSLFAGEGDYLAQTTDNGATWIHNLIVPEVPTTMTASSGVLYFGTTSSGIYRSTDNGATWTAYNQGMIIRNISALYVYNNFLFAGTNSGVYRLPLR